MSSPTILCYADAVVHCQRFMEGRGNAGRAMIREAIQQAYQAVMNAHDWPALTGNWRIQLKARQTTGTVEYDHTGGSKERLVTLTDATFPTDAANYAIKFNGVVCDIEQWIDSTNVTLNAVMNPGANVTETTYVLYPRWYALPDDFVAIHTPVGENSSLGREITMTEMLRRERSSTLTGEVHTFAVSNRPDTFGYKALFVSPAVTSDSTLDFIYERSGRKLTHSGYVNADYKGTVTVASGSALLKGNSTSFADSMVGAIIRFGTTSNLPDGEYGDNRFTEQRSIRAVDATSGAGAITLGTKASATHTTVKYRITDVVDLHQVAFNAFWRFCEYYMGVARDLSKTGEMFAAAQLALKDAMGAAYSTRYDPLDDVILSHLFPGTTEWDS